MLKRPLLRYTFAGLALAVCFQGFAQRSSPPEHRTATARHSPLHPALPPVSFTDVTQAAGIDFHLTCGGPEKRYIMESMCGGFAVFDYDNDGWMDIFLVN